MTDPADGGQESPYALVERERLALLESEPLHHLTAQPGPGSIVIDRFGDSWERGTTRWTCLTPVDGSRILRVARLPWTAFASPHSYGPVRLLREGSNGPWLYETIRPRRTATTTVRELWPADEVRRVR